jgi:general L-amino acid transport system permease protein
VNAPARGATRAARWRPSISTGRVVVALLICASLAALASGNLRFLDEPTSWQLGFSTFPQEPIDPYWKTIAISVANTLMVAAIAIVASTVVGAGLAFLAVSPDALWSRFAPAYVLVFRNVPLVLQALFWFALIAHAPGPRRAAHFAGVVASNRGLSIPFVTLGGGVSLGAAIGALLATLWIMSATSSPRLLTTAAAMTAALAAGIGVHTAAFSGEPILSFPMLTGFNYVGGLTLPTEFASVLIALSMFGSAYIAEIVRGGFATVPKGALEAAYALALPIWIVELRVRAPLALRAILLPLGSQYTTMIKATSIGLAVGYTDLFAVTIRSINQTGHTIALLCLMTACFLVLNHAVVCAVNALNERAAIPGYEKGA